MNRLKARLITAGIAVVLFALPVLGLVGLYQLIFRVYHAGDVPLPDFGKTEWVRAEDRPGGTVQGWARDEAREFHHKSQGSVILPLSWFLALERPLFSPFEVGLFSDPDYMKGFGFNYDPEPVAAGSGPAYPIGFAVQKLAFPAASTSTLSFDRETRVIGLTCAACHTGRIDLKWEGTTRSVLIEGGSAMIDLKKFQDAMGAALFMTQFYPERFRRFARNVLAADTATDPDEEAIRRRLDALIAFGTNQLAIIQERKLIPVEAGYGRTDALSLIGNRVFGAADDKNLSVSNGPVNFPHVWDTAWFDWVQYNASIRMPMARNIGEALGVMALLDIGKPTEGAALGQFQSSVNVENLARMERLLGGNRPFADPGRPPATAPSEPPRYGLQPPRWDEVMGALIGQDPGPRRRLPEALAINPGMADRGKALYRRFCQDCHLHPRDELQAWLNNPCDPGPVPGDVWAEIRSDFTEPDRVSKKRFLKLPVIDLQVIGTDPHQALNFYRRVVVARTYPDKEGVAAGRHDPSDTTISAETGLYWVTSLLRAQAYGQGDLVKDNPGGRLELDRYRSVPEKLDGPGIAGDIAQKIDQGDVPTIRSEVAMGDVIKANLGYKARPLDGAWATPPFLHNGSVPTLDDLLRPVADRPKAFYAGSTLYDPARVGYDTSELANATRFDTSLEGNSNRGHEFRYPSCDELEQAYDIPGGGGKDPQERLARVFGYGVERLRALTTDELRLEYKRVTRNAPRRIPLPGVIGPELTDDERACLLAYLKSI